MSGMFKQNSGVLEKAGWKWVDVFQKGGYWVHPATGQIKGLFPWKLELRETMKEEAADSILDGTWAYITS